MMNRLLSALLLLALLPDSSFAKKLDGAGQIPQPGLVLADANGTPIGDSQANVSADLALKSTTLLSWKTSGSMVCIYIMTDPAAAAMLMLKSHKLEVV